MITDLVKRFGYFYQLLMDRGMIKRLYSLKTYRNTVQALTPMEAAKMVVDILCYLGESREREVISQPQRSSKLFVHRQGSDPLTVRI